jgi:hypothetical protein
MADQPPGLQGSEGQPGNQGGQRHAGPEGQPPGLLGYEGQPGNQGGLSITPSSAWSLNSSAWSLNSSAWSLNSSRVSHRLGRDGGVGDAGVERVFVVVPGAGEWGAVRDVGRQAGIEFGQ